jgi:hypothetical protein
MRLGQAKQRLEPQFLQTQLSPLEQVGVPHWSIFSYFGVTTINTTNTLNLRILGWEEDAMNEDFSAAGIPALVRLNNHYNSANGAIAGGTVSTTGV